MILLNHERKNGETIRIDETEGIYYLVVTKLGEILLSKEAKSLHEVNELFQSYMRGECVA